jgi:hypothetical protein
MMKFAYGSISYLFNDFDLQKPGWIHLRPETLDFQPLFHTFLLNINPKWNYGEPVDDAGPTRKLLRTRLSKKI